MPRWSVILALAAGVAGVIGVVIGIGEHRTRLAELAALWYVESFALVIVGYGLGSLATALLLRRGRL